MGNLRICKNRVYRKQGEMASGAQYLLSFPIVVALIDGLMV
jgi:hypothetical protein